MDQKDKYNTTDVSFASGLGYLSPSGLGNINENSNGFKASNNVAQPGLFLYIPSYRRKSTFPYLILCER